MTNQRRTLSSSPYRNPSVSKLAEIFEKQGDGDYVGEAVSQREHAIQCAMHAERAFPRDKEIAVAALLHDIGHMIGLDPPLYAEVTKGTEFEKGIGRMEDCGIVGHEGIGAHFALQLGFSERVASIIRGHVAAKRCHCCLFDLGLGQGLTGRPNSVGLEFSRRDSTLVLGGVISASSSRLYRRRF